MRHVAAVRGDEWSPVEASGGYSFRAGRHQGAKPPEAYPRKGCGPVCFEGRLRHLLPRASMASMWPTRDQCILGRRSFVRSYRLQIRARDSLGARFANPDGAEAQTR